MMKNKASEGVVMTLSLPSFAGLILLLLAVTDPSIRYADNFHTTLTTLLYLGFITSLIALSLSAAKRIVSSATTKICFVMNLAWILYSSPMLCIVWMFGRHG
jgi:hypothetical protein